jgi:hypothetical protein
MSTTEFMRICADFCELIQVTPPALDPEHDGTVAFHVDWRGVTVDVMCSPARSANHAFVLFELGAIDSAPHDAGRVLLALLQANFLSLRVNPPTFSCHPETGAAVLQCGFPIEGATASALFEFIEMGVDLALEWRKNHLLPDAPMPPSVDAPQWVQSFA